MGQTDGQTDRQTPDCFIYPATGLVDTVEIKSNEYTHTRLTALFRNYPGGPVPER